MNIDGLWILLTQLLIKAYFVF